MKFSSFVRLFGERWQRNASSRPRRGKARRALPVKPPRLAVEALEDRTLMSVLPSPTVLGQFDVNRPGSGLNDPSTNQDNASSPQVAVDPLNPLNLVSIYTRNDPTLNPSVVVQGSVSTDGGQTWKIFALPPNPIDFTNPTTQFAEATDASVAFDRNGNFFVLYSAHSALAGGTYANGEVLLEKYAFSGGVPSPQFNKVLDVWNVVDPALAPTLAVDDNVPLALDPDTGAMQSDPYVNNIYVAWGTNDQSPTGAGPNFKPNTIQMIVSSDGGQSFGGPVEVDGGTYTGTDRNAYPRLVVSQGTLPAGGTGGFQRATAPGQVSVVWDDFGSSNAANVDNIVSNRITNGGAGFVFNGTGGQLNDAGAGTPNVPATTDFLINIPQVTDPTFVNISDLDVTVNIVHPSLDELSIVLFPPVATGLPPITLLRNGTNADGSGNPPGVGFPSGTANLGVLNGFDLGTTFDDEASAKVNDTNNFPPFVGHFKPDGGALSIVRKLKPAQLQGLWTLEITDFRNGNTGRLDNWSMSFTSGMTPGTKSVVAQTSVRGTLPTSNFPNAGNTPASPLRGIGPAPVIASDNTLGSFSTNQGRLYVAYVGRSTAAGNPADNTDIFLATSDDGGVTWQSSGTPVNDDNAVTDGFSEAQTGLSGRAQFQPSIAVDPSTGALALSWYDARNDPSRTRVATYVTTSIDGGQTFSPDVFADIPQQVFNAITQTMQTVGPFPENPSQNSDPLFSFGDRQGLVFLQGHLYPVFTTNLDGGNFGLTQQRIFVAPMVTAAGPRIVSSTMGPVQAFTAGGVTYNDTFASDGTQQLSAFLVTFDRPVDINTFDSSDVTVTYRDVNTPGSSPGNTIPVSSVIPVNNGVYGATQFVVTFPPQSGVGTYSYVVGPNIRDLIRSVTTVVTPLGTNTYPQNQSVPIPPVSTRTSVIAVSGIPTTQVVTKVTVTMSITFPTVQNLSLVLVAPDGTQVRLVNENTTTGSNFGGTTFDDAATTPITAGISPFTGVFQPEAPLAQLIDKNPNGNWQLVITNFSPSPTDTGSLNQWSLNLQTGIVSTQVTSGNLMDQNANAKPGEDPAVTSVGPGDSYAAPRPTESAASTGAFFAPPYDPTTLPLVVPGPHIVSAHVPNNPVTADNLVQDAITVPSPAVPLTIGPGQKVTSSFNVTDDYVIVSAILQLSITDPNTSDLTITLIAPDGTRITLASGVGKAGSANFTNTVFDDSVATPIAGGTAPFTSRFLPQQPLAVLGGRFVTGQYQLEIVNNSATNTATLNSWSMTFRKSAFVSSIDVTFDRDMTPSTITPASIVRITGPSGVINGPFTITPDPDNVDPDPFFKRTYRIGFPAQSLSGTYTIVLASSVEDRNGNALDTNENAGVDVLRGTGVAGQLTSVSYTSNVHVGIPDKQTVNSTISVPDSFLIQNLTVTLNITHTSDPDLSATLIAPDGTRVLLFSNVGQAGSGQNFSNTVFSDAATTPIQNAGAPFLGQFNPQSPLSVFNGKQAMGTWTLQITDSVANGKTGTLTNWVLNFAKPVPQTGLGESVADQATVSFRIFATDPSDPTAFENWTAVGPAPVDSGVGAGKVSALAVDPSDPSGNTVYIGAAAGGVWKTTNFLTTNPNGPTWIPLTDFGPTHALNVSTITVFPRNNDPSQSIIFVGTGDADTDSPSVGILRSMNGGATWDILDSTNNEDASGNISPINAATRDHEFSGKGGYFINKIVVDPHLSPTGDVILYAALSTSNPVMCYQPGLYRSDDSGRTWKLMRLGNATDVVLDPDSGTVDALNNPTGNLQRVYASFEPFSVPGTTISDPSGAIYKSSNRFSDYTLMAGGVGKPLVQDADVNPPGQIPVNAPNPPVGANIGRIRLAKPALTGNPEVDAQYAGWLWATVLDNTTGRLAVYITKDFGDNWTLIALPTLPGAIPSNNPANPNVPVASGVNGEGALALTLDPTNPNIAYIGGAGASTGLIRVDATFVHDAHAFFQGASNADGGQLLSGSSDPIQIKSANPPPTPFATIPPALSPITSPTVDMIRTPNAPFVAGATFYVTNVATFVNSGNGVNWIPLNQVGLANPLAPVSLSNPTSTGYHQIVAFTDPLTGRTRLIFGNDDGVYTMEDQGNGQLLNSIGDVSNVGAAGGDVPVVNGGRNGNLQITQFFYGASQPSSLAAQLATLQGMFYGESSGLGSLASDPNILTDGNLNWTPTPIAPPLRNTSARGSGTGVATDQTGSGTVYQYQWPCCGGNITDFFRVNGVGRTFGLIQGNSGGQVPDPQWPFGTGFNFAVNPVNKNQIVLGSEAGRVFTTFDGGLTWQAIAEPSELDGSPITALAFGAPQPNDPVGAINQFIYVGTQAGNIFVTFNGGGTGGTWTQMTGDLDGSPIQQIVTNPNRGSREAYAVTKGGVQETFDTGLANQNKVIPAGMTIPISLGVPVDIYIQDLEVDVTSASTPGSLVLVLVSPDGTQVLLSGGTGPNVGTIFDDHGLDFSKGLSPFTGHFKPVQPLSQLIPQDARGGWTLEVTNTDPKNNATLVDWSLLIIGGGNLVHVDETSQWANGNVGNVFLTTQNSFGNAANQQFQPKGLRAAAIDWRYVIPDSASEVSNPSGQPGPTHPVIYLAGDTGVYRTLDNGASWTLFPNTSVDGSTQNDGFLPSIEVTDLDLALGNINPTTGQPDTANGPDLLLATTNGRGEFAIRVPPVTVAGSLRLDPNLPAPLGSATTVANTTKTIQPVIDGLSMQSAFGNVVRIDLINLDAPNHPLVGTGTTDANGRFAVQVNPGVFKADGTTDGLHHFGVRAIDGSGAVGPIQEFDFTLDTTPIVVASSLQLDANSPAANPATFPVRPGSDSGLSATDRITNVTQPVFDGVVQQAAPVTVQLFDVTNPNQPILLGTTTTDANGNFQIITSAGIYKSDGSTDGVHSLSITVFNATRQSQQQFPGFFTLDTIAPLPPSITLSTFSDSGPSNTDHVTNVITPTFTGKGEPNALVQIFAQSSTASAPTEVGQGNVDSSGNYSVTVSPLAPGTYTITAQQVDVAGNVGKPSAPLAPPLVILTALPTVPTIFLDPGSDTGVPGDNITAAIPQVYDGTNPAGTSILFKDGVNPIGPFDTTKIGVPQLVKVNGVTLATYVQVTATTYQLTWSLTQGVHSITVIATDLAGNSATSAVLTITVDPDSLDPDRKFIRQLYSLALGRPGTLAEWNLWAPLLQQPDGRSIVANGIDRSVEARDVLVKSWYMTYLGRVAVNGEEMVWVNALVGGATEEQTLAAILASDEYFLHSVDIPGVAAPPSNTSFVRSLYVQLLGRQASQFEINIWLSVLQTSGRAAVSFGILTSVEYREDVVRGYYINLLQRPSTPSNSEIDIWALSALDLTSIRVDIEASPEFFSVVTGFHS